MGFLGDIVKGFANANPIGMIANAATSVIGGAITQNMANKQQQRNQERQNAWQAEQAQISRDWQADQAALQNEWSEKMNLQQQQWQEGMWNKTNEWNSEGARMQRLLDAGVNPNNAAGLISGNQTAAQLAQQPQIPNANPYPSTAVPSGGQMSGPTILDGMNAMANTKLASAQARLVDAQAENQEIKNGYQDQLSQAELSGAQETVRKIIADREYTDEQKKSLVNFGNDAIAAQAGKDRAEALRTLGLMINDMKEYQIMDQDYKKKQQELSNLKKEARLIDEKVNTEKHNQGYADAAAANQSQQAQTGKAQEQKLRSETEGQDIQNKISNVEKDLKDLEVERQKRRTKIMNDTGVDPENTTILGGAIQIATDVKNYIKNTVTEAGVKLPSKSMKTASKGIRIRGASKRAQQFINAKINTKMNGDRNP